jgi:predicted MPP superfamily phosphohydrolase
VLPVPAHWPRLSILHLSDLHVHTGGDRLYRAQARFLRTLPEGPDLLCVTGDVCERLADAPRAAALLGRLRPRLGALLVLGNHEHFAPIPADLRRSRRSLWGRLARASAWLLATRLHSSGTAEARAIADRLDEAGLPVLTNQGRRFAVDGRTLWVAGVDSVWSGHAHVGAAMLGRHDGEPCLGLVHEPDGAPALIARGADLVLSGHTHGGQVRLPLFGSPYTLRADPRVRIPAGLQRLGRGLLHVSTGLGHSAPLRLRCPPEATWIDCVPTAGAEPLADRSDRSDFDPELAARDA